MKNNYKPMVYEEHGKGCIVLVTSRDPKTKIQILKDQQKKRRQKTKDKGSGVFSFLDN